MMNEKDRVKHITLMDGMVRGLFMTARDTVAKMQSIHLTTPVATAALGRTIMGAAMLGRLLKAEGETVTLTISGGGPIGKLLAVADERTVRGVCDNPQAELPLRADGKLDVGKAVGRDGRVSVAKDLLMKNPYIGQTSMVSGEIAEDLAAYFLESEQTPSLLSLGVLTAGDAVLSAGGVLLQPMPGCPDEIIGQLEKRSPLMADISRELANEPMESLIRGWFDGLKPVIIDETPLSYECKCSRERMEKALIALGRKELEGMISDDIDGAQLLCHFCKTMYSFTTHDLIRLLNRAAGR